MSSPLARDEQQPPSQVSAKRILSMKRVVIYTVRTMLAWFCCTVYILSGQYGRGMGSAITYCRDNMRAGRVRNIYKPQDNAV